MVQGFRIHLSKKEFGDAAGMSWWAVNRLCKAGVAKTVQFPSGERIHAAWARQKLENGFTREELAQLSRYNREKRQGTGPRHVNDILPIVIEQATKMIESDDPTPSNDDDREDNPDEAPLK